MRPICRLPKDDCGTPMRPILSEQSGHTRIRTATSRVGRHAGNPVSAGRVRNVIVFLYLPLSTSRSSTVRPLSVTKRRIRIGGLKPKYRSGA